MHTTGTVRKDVLDSLRSIPLFGRVSETDLEELATHLIERRFPKNATVVEEGLPGDYMYVIREGRAKVTKASEDGREKIMNFLAASRNVLAAESLSDAPCCWAISSRICLALRQSLSKVTRTGISFQMYWNPWL